MSKLSQFQGTPYHKEFIHRSANDPRRHSHRCIYFSKTNKHCSKIVGICTGSAHCKYYKEKESNSSSDNPLKHISTFTSSCTSKPTPDTMNYEIGMTVKSVKYGIGKITNICVNNGTKIIYVDFHGQDKQFHYETVVQNQLLTVLPNASFPAEMHPPKASIANSNDEKLVDFNPSLTSFFKDLFENCKEGDHKACLFLCCSIFFSFSVLAFLIFLAITVYSYLKFNFT